MPLQQQQSAVTAAEPWAAPGCRGPDLPRECMGWVADPSELEQPLSPLALCQLGSAWGAEKWLCGQEGFAPRSSVGPGVWGETPSKLPPNPHALGRATRHPCRNLDTIISLPGGESLRGFILVTLLVEKAAVPGIKVGYHRARSSLLARKAPAGARPRGVPRGSGCPASPCPNIPGSSTLCTLPSSRRQPSRLSVPSCSSMRRPCTEPCGSWRRPSGT